MLYWSFVFCAEIVLDYLNLCLCCADATYDSLFFVCSCSSAFDKFLFPKYCGERMLMNRNGIKNFDTLELECLVRRRVTCAAHFLPAVD